MTPAPLRLSLKALSARVFAPVLAGLCALALSACGAGDGPVGEPALYRVDAAEAPADAQAAGWLFGTIHALPEGAQWRDARVENALDASGVLVVEIADLDGDLAAKTFARLSKSPALPPISARVKPEYRDELAELIEETGADPKQLRTMESWAAALTLSSLAQGLSGLDTSEGVDRALIADYPSDRVIGLETIEQQFSMFDRLPESAQRQLLNAMLADSAASDPKSMSAAWLNGDADHLADLMNDGLGEDGNALREALLTQRNAAWATPIEGLMKQGRHPFVAVGAGHIGGKDGLIALLEERGWRITRVR